MCQKNRGTSQEKPCLPALALPFFCQRVAHNNACTQSPCYGSKLTDEAACLRLRCRKPCSHRWAAVRWSLIVMIRDSHSRGQGQICGRCHTQARGEASVSCQNCKRAEPKAQVGRRGRAVWRNATRWSCSVGMIGGDRGWCLGNLDQSSTCVRRCYRGFNAIFRQANIILSYSQEPAVGLILQKC